MRKSHVVRIAFPFLFILTLIFCKVQSILVAPDPSRTDVWIRELYDEPTDTMDVVIIGGSYSYTLFQSPLAWRSSGITVWNYACESQRLVEAKYMIKEARKLQPNACYVVCVNGLFGKWRENIIHYLSDNMRFSINKLEMINRTCDLAEYGLSERLEYVIPIIRYHDRWRDVTVNDFHQNNMGMKGADIRTPFLTVSEDETIKYHPTNKNGKLSSDIRDIMDELLDYLDQNEIKAVFMAAPQFRSGKVISQYNSALKVAKKRGYPTLNLYEYMDNMHLDLTQDYYNQAHINIFGSIKATAFLADYFTEYLELTDKRNDCAYASWDDAYTKYQSEYLAQVIPEKLMDVNERDFSISAPGDEAAEKVDRGILVSWGNGSKADGYRLYKKTGDEPFLFVTDTDAEVRSYIDKIAQGKEKLTYIIVPYTIKNGRRIFGNYKNCGVIVE